MEMIAQDPKPRQEKSLTPPRTLASKRVREKAPPEVKRLLGDNNHWRGGQFTLCYRKNTSTKVALECACYYPHHGGKCRKRLHFRKYGGEANVEILLKYWLLQGPSVKLQKSHKDVPMPELASMPSLLALERMPFATPP